MLIGKKKDHSPQQQEYQVCISVLNENGTKRISQDIIRYEDLPNQQLIVRNTKKKKCQVK